MPTLTPEQELAKLKSDTTYGGGARYGRTPKGIVDLSSGSLVEGTGAAATNPIASSGIRRETGLLETPAAPSYATEAERIIGGLNREAPTSTDKEKIREEQLARVRGQLDAIDSTTASMLAAESARATGRLGQGRSISARSGVLGSDMGARRESEIQGLNKQNEETIKGNQEAKKTMILAGAEQRAVDLIEAETNKALKNTDTYLSFLAQKQTEARSDIKSLAASGVALETLAEDEYTKLLQQSGYDKFVFDAVYNSQLPAAKKKEYEFVNLGGGKVVRFDKTNGGDPDYFDYSIPEGFTFKMAGDIPVFVNEKTQEVKVAEAKGDTTAFEKETELDTFTNAEGKRVSVMYNPASKTTRTVVLGSAQKPEGQQYTGFNGFTTKPQAAEISAVNRFLQDTGRRKGLTREDIATDIKEAAANEAFFYATLNSILRGDNSDYYYRPTTFGMPASYAAPKPPQEPTDEPTG
jgi:hypothetical protein